jgi:hypothetical protein
MIKNLGPPLSAFCLVTVCTEPASTSRDPLFTQLAGKTLTTPRQAVMLRRDGTMSGRVGPNPDQPFAGSWTVRDGRFCRTITKTEVLPDGIPATKCQTVAITGDQATFTSPNGRSTTQTLS